MNQNIFFDKSYIFDSTNNNINYKLAYLYNLINSTQRMKYHFQKVNDSNLKVRNIYSGIMNNNLPFYLQKQYFELGDSLLSILHTFKKDFSITFKIYTEIASKYSYSYSSKNSFTIKGDGSFEGIVEDIVPYVSNHVVKGYLPNHILEQIIEELNSIRMFSLNNNFFYSKNKENFIHLRNQYYITDTYDSYFEITINTPIMRFSSSVLWLLLPDVEYYKLLNYTCPFSKNICNLENFWLKYYNYDFLKQYETKD